MAQLEFQSQSIAAHPQMFQDCPRMGWPMGLQPLAGDFLFLPSNFGRTGVEAENLFDILGTEDSSELVASGYVGSLSICDEDTQEPIGVEIDGLFRPYYPLGTSYLLTLGL